MQKRVADDNRMYTKVEKKNVKRNKEKGKKTLHHIITIITALSERREIISGEGSPRKKR